MMRDYLSLAMRNLRHRPKRSWLTIIGILIGMAAVVALVSLGQGFQQAIDREFEGFGYNVIWVMGGGSLQYSWTSTFELDLNSVQKIEGVAMSGAMLWKTPYVQTEEKEGFLPVYGLEPSLMKDFSGYYAPKVGTILKDGETRTAVLGSDVAEDLGLSVGDRLIIERPEYEFTVVGILKERADPDFNDSIYIPLSVLQEIVGETEKFSFVLIKTKDGYDVKEVADRTEKQLKEERGKDDLNIQTMEELRDLMGNIIGIAQAFLGGIAAIALLVGSVGVMNTMYMAVLERTREIGVMKAIGARRRDILALFLLESGFMGLVGGLLGTALGLGISIGTTLLVRTLTKEARFLEAAISVELIVSALVLSFVLGALSGWLPARNAAKLPPVEALRYE
jgi:putative ABC transport system permease protein